MPATQEVVHAYRNLYRGLLRAVQYAQPARFVARDAIRSAFREPGAVHDAEGIKRTAWFLQAAAKERGLEHRILKNLVQVRFDRFGVKTPWKKVLQERRHKNPFDEHAQAAYKHYDMTVAMLNESMGLCLR